jgi:hypothetical protein
VPGSGNDLNVTPSVRRGLLHPMRGWTADANGSRAVKDPVAGGGRHPKTRPSTAQRESLTAGGSVASPADELTPLARRVRGTYSNEDPALSRLVCTGLHRIHPGAANPVI